MTVTVNDVRDGVIAALKQSFPQMKVYGEEMKQGLKEPCFFVALLASGHHREVGQRYKRTHSFDVHYFSGKNADGHHMADQLYSVLEYITWNGNVYRGQSMKHEIVDGVLHFFVDYNFHVLKPKEVYPKMQTMTQEELVKDG